MLAIFYGTVLYEEGLRWASTQASSYVNAEIVSQSTPAEAYGVPDCKKKVEAYLYGNGDSG